MLKLLDSWWTFGKWPENLLRIKKEGFCGKKRWKEEDQRQCKVSRSLARVDFLIDPLERISALGKSISGAEVFSQQSGFSFL